MKFSEKGSTLDERMDEFSTTLIQQSNEYVEDMDTLKAMVHGATEKHEEEIDNHHKYFFQQCVTLNKMFADGNAGVLTKLDDAQKDYKERCAFLEKRLSETHDELSNKAMEETKKLEFKLADYDQKELIDKETMKLAQKLQSLDQKMKTRVDGIDEKYNERCTTMRRELETQVQSSAGDV